MVGIVFVNVVEIRKRTKVFNSLKNFFKNKNEERRLLWRKN